MYTDICGALISGEICRKSMVTSQVGEAYNVRDSGDGKNQQCVGAKLEATMEMIRAEENLERDLWNVIIATRRFI